MSNGIARLKALLRQPLQKPSNLFDDAAVEIERLRAKIDEIAAALRYPQGSALTGAQNAACALFWLSDKLGNPRLQGTKPLEMLLVEFAIKKIEDLEKEERAEDIYIAVNAGLRSDLAQTRAHLSELKRIVCGDPEADAKQVAAEVGRLHARIEELEREKP